MVPVPNGPKYVLADETAEEQEVAGGSAFDIVSVTADPGHVFSGDTVTLEAEIDAQFSDTQSASVGWFLGELSSGTRVARESYSAAGSGSVSFATEVTWQDLVNLGQPPGEYNLIANVVVSNNQKTMTGSPVTIRSEEEDRGVSVTCTSGDLNVQDGETTGFTADVTNNTGDRIDADIEWRAEGTLIGFTGVEVAPYSTAEAATSGVSFGYLADRIGRGDHDYKVVVDEYFPA